MPTIVNQNVAGIQRTLAFLPLSADDGSEDPPRHDASAAGPRADGSEPSLVPLGRRQPRRARLDAGPYPARAAAVVPPRERLSASAPAIGSYDRSVMFSPE